MKIKLLTLPNIITLLNLLCGSLAIVSLISLPAPQALQIAFFLIIAAAVLDFLDGLVARWLNQESAIGVQLDSLADIVSFGLAPTLIALMLFNIAGGSGLWGLLIFAIVLCSAVRLAKFNIDEGQKASFTGLPVPANALLIGTGGYFVATYEPLMASYMPWVIIGIALLLSYLLVSPVRMFSLKFNGWGFRENATRYTLLVIAAALLILFGWNGVGMAIIIYILASTITWLSRKRDKA